MKVKKYNHLGDKLPIWHFDDEFMIYHDGAMGAGFKINGADISCSTSDSINIFCQQIANLLNSLDDGIKIQLFYRVSPNIGSILDKHEKETSHIEGELRPLIDSRLNFLKKNKEDGNYYCPELYLFVKSKSQNIKKDSILKPVEFYQQLIENDYQSARDQITKIVTHVGDYLNSMGLSYATLNRDEWFKLLFEYFNLDRSEKIGTSALRESEGDFPITLLEQCLLTDVLIHQNFIQVGEYYFKFVNLGTLPEQTFSSMANQLTKMSFHYWISQSVEVKSQALEKEKLELQRRIAHSMAVGSKNVSDLESEAKLSNLEGLLQEVIAGSEKILSMGMTVILWDKDLKELDRKVDQVLREFRNLNQAEGIIETIASFDTFIASFPGSGSSFRSKKLKTSNVAHLLPLYSSWMGNDRPVCLFVNRDFVPFAIDPFAPELPNWNGLVVGGSGAGKSFALTQLMLQFSTQKPTPKIVFVDNGKSSQNFVESCAGEFIDVSLDSRVCLNPFDLGAEKRPSVLKVKSLLAIFEIIFRDEGLDHLNKHDKAQIEEAIYKLYESSSQNPTLTDFRKLLLSHSSISLKRFGEVLFSWTGNTAYGKLLDGQSNIALNKNITAIEVKSLDDFPELKDVFMLLITNFVQREAEKDLSSPYVLICDEAHRLFKTQSTRDYIMYCYRVFRKYNCSIFCITQNHKDFLSIPEVADAIFPNTTHVFVLRQRKIDWEDFQKTFDFNEAEIDAIKSLQIKKREYSEVFYMQDERRAILKIVPDELSYWVCTSDGSDKAKILEMQNKFPDLSKIRILEKVAYGEDYVYEVS
jgi:conjugal transfer ATP-binding protein TraC